MSLGGFGSILGGILNILAPLFVTPAAVFIAKKLHDDAVRKAIATAADAALVLVISKSGVNGFSSIAEVMRQVTQQLLEDRKVSTTDPDVAKKAAAAAVARSGLTTVQTVHMNPDGTVVPVTKIPG